MWFLTVLFLTALPREEECPNPIMNHYMFNRTMPRRLAPVFVKFFALLVSQAMLHAGPTKGASHATSPVVNLPEVARGMPPFNRLGRSCRT